MGHVISGSWGGGQGYDGRPPCAFRQGDVSGGGRAHCQVCLQRSPSLCHGFPPFRSSPGLELRGAAGSRLLTTFSATWSAPRL